MNPLTQVKRIQKINSTEAALGISDEASWHAKYKDSAYVFVGGIPFDLTEGDLLAVFAQYGEIVDVNLVRDKGTGKSKGFAFVAYEDQRSTILAVDNLNGAKILGRIVRVDHVTRYKKKEEDEDAEKAQQKREARGICHAYQRGECNRGATCKFSHDEQRSRNSGWGPKDSDSRWGHDMHDDPPRSHKNFSHNASDQTLQSRDKDGELKSKSIDRGGRPSRIESKEDYSNSQGKRSESSLKDQEGQRSISERTRNETRSEDDRDMQTREKPSGRFKSEPREEDDRVDRQRVRRYDGETSSRYRREEDKQQERRRAHG